MYSSANVIIISIYIILVIIVIISNKFLYAKDYVRKNRLNLKYFRIR